MKTKKVLGLLFALAAIVSLSGSALTGPGTDQNLGDNIPEITIGSQTWMSANLAVTHFRNGDPIFFATNRDEWMKAWENKEAAYCCYDDDLENGKSYGFLYNWYAVDDERGLAPEGWRIPSDKDWKTLEMAFGMSKSVADETGMREGKEGLILKSKKYWNGGKGNNKSGFNALPAGARSAMGHFNDSFGNSTSFWTSTETDKYQAFKRILKAKEKGIGRWDSPKATGMSVRCVKE